MSKEDDKSPRDKYLMVFEKHIYSYFIASIHGMRIYSRCSVKDNRLTGIYKGYLAPERVRIYIA